MRENRSNKTPAPVGHRVLTTAETNPRVNHDRLVARLATRVKDKRVLKLMRSFLNSGVMIGGLEQPKKEGTPQGGPLSPILSNTESFIRLRPLPHWIRRRLRALVWKHWPHRFGKCTASPGPTQLNCSVLLVSYLRTFLHAHYFD
jgi:hypothetical protein